MNLVIPTPNPSIINIHGLALNEQENLYSAFKTTHQINMIEPKEKQNMIEPNTH